MARREYSRDGHTDAVGPALGRHWVSDELVSGFRRYDRAFVTRSTGDAGEVVACPSLRGFLVAAEVVLDAACQDQGRLVTARPGAVLFPADSGDVAAVVRWCAELGIPVAARGSGHTCFGQSLVEEGVSIAMHGLSRIYAVGNGVMEVDAGAEWLQVTRAAAAHGQRPPSLPGYLNLTVGGTLSVGGVGAIPTEGAQVDRVRSLEVVTGTGELVVCSRTERPALFWAALAGLGQVGIITRVELELVPAPRAVRCYLFEFGDPASLLGAARRLLPDLASELYLRVLPPAGDAPSRFVLVACSYQYGPREPGEVDTELLVGLPAPVQATEQAWLDYVEEVTHLIGGFQAAGWDDRIKAWSDLFLPDHAVQRRLEETLADLTWEQWGAAGTEQGFVLLFPHVRSSFTAPLLRLPEPGSGEIVWLLDVLSVSPDQHAADYAARVMDRNRRLAGAARAEGGFVYPIGATRLTAEDWRWHYGPQWEMFTAAKNEFDPKRVLTPGPQIFGPR